MRCWYRTSRFKTSFTMPRGTAASSRTNSPHLRGSRVRAYGTRPRTTYLLPVYNPKHEVTPRALVLAAVASCTRPYVSRGLCAAGAGAVRLSVFLLVPDGLDRTDQCPFRIRIFGNNRKGTDCRVWQPYPAGTIFRTSALNSPIYNSFCQSYAPGASSKMTPFRIVSPYSVL